MLQRLRNFSYSFSCYFSISCDIRYMHGGWLVSLLASRLSISICATNTEKQKDKVRWKYKRKSQAHRPLTLEKHKKKSFSLFKLNIHNSTISSSQTIPNPQTKQVFHLTTPPQSITFSQNQKEHPISQKMPSSNFESHVQQILQADNEDKRSQPWMEEMEAVINNPVNGASEVVPTGGACDVLKFVFPC